MEKVLEEVQKRTLKALDEGAHPIAAFDADGTLWHNDVSYIFFKHYYAQEKSLWKEFYQIQEKSYREALFWLATRLEGQRFETFKKDCRELMVHSSPQKIELQEKVISFLQKEGVEIFVVTGSIEWIVEEAALSYGIPRSHVLGIKTKVEKGVITSQLDGFLTWEEGKRDSVMEATVGKRPFLCAGNTLGDLELLETATHIQLVINQACPIKKKDMYQSERELLKLAKQRNWLFLES